jgi:hypothetical protein
MGRRRADDGWMDDMSQTQLLRSSRAELRVATRRLEDRLGHNDAGTAQLRLVLSVLDKLDAAAMAREYAAQAVELERYPRRVAS